MGTSAFVALLMTLCNKSFSATICLLYPLPLSDAFTLAPWRGWFVEPTAGRHFIYSRSSRPYRGLFCCWSAARRWNIPSGRNTSCRAREYHAAYRFALRLLMAGCLALVGWLTVLIMNATTDLSLPLQKPFLAMRCVSRHSGDLTGGML